MIDFSDKYNLLPCPFCGGKAYMEACDRLENIGCRACNYHMYGHGIVQSEIVTNVVASYDSEGNPLEWYDSHASEKLVAKWNRRNG